MQNLNYIHPKAMNTENLVFCRKPWWYSRGGHPSFHIHHPSTPLHASEKTCGPHMAQNLWFTTSDWERMDRGNCTAVGFKPEFPRLNWQSLGAWARQLDELIGGNESLFTQLVGEMLGEYWGSPQLSPGAYSQVHILAPSPPLLPPCIVVCELC